MSSRKKHKEHINMMCPMSGGDSGTFGLCCGDSCMAWRWLYKVDISHKSEPLIKSDEGYCGLAGKP